VNRGIKPKKEKHVECLNKKKAAVLGVLLQRVWRVEAGDLQTANHRSWGFKGLQGVNPRNRQD